MKEEAVESLDMDSCKKAMVQVAMSTAQGIGKTPSERNGFLMAVSLELVARALAYQPIERREPIMQMFHLAALDEAVIQEGRLFPAG